MLRIIPRFGKHCSCHLQGECLVVRRFWESKACVGQAVGGEFEWEKCEELRGDRLMCN
jgi:hypothetical protein